MKKVYRPILFSNFFDKYHPYFIIALATVIRELSSTCIINWPGKKITKQHLGLFGSLGLAF